MCTALNSFYYDSTDTTGFRRFLYLLSISSTHRHLREEDYSLAQPTCLCCQLLQPLWSTFWRYMWGKCIDLPPHSVPAAGLPTTANEHSLSLRCLWFYLTPVSSVPKLYRAPTSGVMNLLLIDLPLFLNGLYLASFSLFSPFQYSWQ